MRRGLWIGFVLILMACSDVSPPNATPRQPTAEPSVALAEVEQFIGQSLPASATNLEAVSQSGIDTLYYVQFDAPAADVEAFVSALGATLQPNLNPFPTVGDTPAWWGATTAQGIAGASFIGANGRGFEVLVGQGSAEMQRVFLRVFDL